MPVLQHLDGFACIVSWPEHRLFVPDMPNAWPARHLTAAVDHDFAMHHLLALQGSWHVPLFQTLASCRCWCMYDMHAASYVVLQLVFAAYISHILGRICCKAHQVSGEHCKCCRQQLLWALAEDYNGILGHVLQVLIACTRIVRCDGSKRCRTLCSGSTVHASPAFDPCGEGRGQERKQLIRERYCVGVSS